MLSLQAALVALAISSAGGGGDTVLLDFRADWCGPCRSMDPTVEQLAAKGYPVRRVNVDQNRDLAKRFGIQSIPCFVMVVNGAEAGRVVGPTSLGRLEQLCSAGRTAVPNSAAPNSAAPNPSAMLAMPGRTAPAWNPNPQPAAAASVAFPATPQRPQVSDAALLAATVRLRVDDPQGRSCGSGTIIDARPGGEALVLTCGHLFRDSKGIGRVEVDVYGPNPVSGCVGRVIAYDLKRDVGLVAFHPQGAVTVARVAPPSYTVRPGDGVASVGCNNGDDPTVQHSRVNSLNRFLGPPNLQVAGQPIVGRSGGGLFSAEGAVIGVCNAADPKDQEGLFAAVGSISAALDEQGLPSVCRQALALPTIVAMPGSPNDAAAAAQPAATQPTADPFSVPRGPVSPSTTSPTANNSGNVATLSSGEQSAVEEIRRAPDQCRTR